MDLHVFATTATAREDWQCPARLAAAIGWHATGITAWPTTDVRDID